MVVQASSGSVEALHAADAKRSRPSINLLLIIGIVTLRDSRSGAKLHWAYVLIKIPLVILAIVAHSWLASGFIAGMTASANAAAAAGGTAPVPPNMGPVATFWVVLIALAAFAYPLALIVVLLTKTVRKYYSFARDD